VKTIARCEKCGRGFVWLNPTHDTVDHFYPANKPLRSVAMLPDEQCGGKIVLIETEAS
jgi:hypothetical protein